MSNASSATGLREFLDTRGPERGIVVIKTEPHLLDKYAFLRGVRATVIDLTAYARTRGLVARFRAGRAAIRELRALAAELDETHTVIADVTEGWFGTTLFCAMHRLFPRALLVGIQHGVMELTGPESQVVVRRLRVLAAQLQWRLFGVNVIGAGFGNNPFHLYGCYGDRYAAYVRRLHPRIRTIIDFPGLTSVHREVGTPASAYDMVFLGQDLRSYGVRDSAAMHRPILARLAEVATRRGIRVLVRMHPKQRIDADFAREFPVLNFDSSGPLAAVLNASLQGVISFNSTGLIEAAYLGCPIVAVRIPGISKKWYEPFTGAVPFENFVSRWDMDRFSSVREDEIGGDARPSRQSGREQAVASSS